MKTTLYLWAKDSILRTVRIIKDVYRAICGPGEPERTVVDVQDVHTGEQFDCVSIEALQAVPTPPPQHHAHIKFVGPTQLPPSEPGSTSLHSR